MTAKLPELTPVTLTREWLAMVTIPAGWRGTVVHVHADGAAYAVEFSDDQGRGIVVDLPAAYVERTNA